MTSPVKLAERYLAFGHVPDDPMRIVCEELLRLHEHKADGGGRENTATAQATISTEDSASTEPESSGPAAAATREGVIEKARARELRQT